MPLSNYNFRPLQGRKCRRLPAADNTYQPTHPLRRTKQWKQITPSSTRNIPKSSVQTSCTAKWLLDGGYIPCQNSGKITRRYKIRIDDVATYLRTLETAPETVAAPVGLFNNKNKCINPIAQIEVRDFQRFLYKLWSAEPDALTPKDVRRLVGYCLATIGQWLTQQKLESVMLPDRTQVIAKRSLVEFISEYIVQNPTTLSKA